MSSNGTSQQRFGFIPMLFAAIGVVVVGFGVLFFGLLFYMVHSFSASLDGEAVSTTTVSSNPKVHYLVPTGKQTYVAGVKLSGEINAGMADIVIDKLENAKEDTNAVGVLLEVDSPGGAVVPSQEIYDQVKLVSKQKPVVVYVRSMAASGAFYSSASASEIIANRGSLLGSIGVIMQGFQADKLAQFLKLNLFTVKTGALKDAGSPMRPMNDDDKKYFQSIAESTRSQFVADVKAGRHVSDQTLAFMSDGRVVLAPQALELKLIDAIGNRDFALDEIAKLAKLKKTPDLFYYENVDSFSTILSQSFSGKVTEVFQNSVSSVLKSSIPSSTQAQLN